MRRYMLPNRRRVKWLFDSRGFPIDWDGRHGRGWPGLSRWVVVENYNRLHIYLNVCFADCDLRHASEDHELREWMRIRISG
jgi:hypothetical protein